jgi:hypothetical protein
MFTTIRPNHQVWYFKVNDNQSHKDFFLLALQSYEIKYGLIPIRIVCNIKDIEFLKGKRGVIYKGHKIPIDTAKNCGIHNVQMWQTDH